MQCEILDSHPRSCSLARLLLNFGEYIAVELVAAKNDETCDAKDQDNRHQTDSYPTEFSFPRHNSTYCGSSKCLSQGDVELCSFHALYRIQVSSDIKTYGADGSGVP